MSFDFLRASSALPRAGYPEIVEQAYQSAATLWVAMDSVLEVRHNLVETELA